MYTPEIDRKPPFPWWIALILLALLAMAAQADGREPRGSREAHRMGLLNDDCVKRQARIMDTAQQAVAATGYEIAAARVACAGGDLAKAAGHLELAARMNDIATVAVGAPSELPPSAEAPLATKAKHWKSKVARLESDNARNRDEGSSPWAAPSIVSARLWDAAAADGAKAERASIKAEQGWLYYGVWALTHWHYVLVAGAVVLLAFVALWIASIFMPALAPVVALLGALLRLFGNGLAAVLSGGATLAGHALGWMQSRLTAKALTQTVAGVQTIKDSVAHDDAELRARINTLLRAHQDNDVQAKIVDVKAGL